MSNWYTYEPAVSYRRRQARQWTAQARKHAFQTLARDQLAASGQDPDLLRTSPTMLDRPGITGRDVDAIMRPRPEEKGGGPLGVLGRALDDATSTVFGGKVRQPWDVLRPIKRIMDAENRYIAKPVASGLYEGVTGSDYEDAPGLVKFGLEALASPSTYIGPGTVTKLVKGAGAGKAAIKLSGLAQETDSALLSGASRVASKLTGTPAAIGGGASGSRLTQVPDAALRKLVGGQLPAFPMLTAQDKALNALKRTVGIGVEEEATATTIMRHRGDLRLTAEGLANRLGAVAGRRTRQAFKVDEKGRIASIPGAPTIQDLAAKLPEFDQYLDDGQRKVLGELRDEMDFYHGALTEQGIEIGSRADVVEGGFYLPRGNALEEGADAPLKVYAGGGRAGTRKGFEKSAVFESMTQGIEAGFEYAPFDDAIKSYARDAANRSIDAYSSNVFKNAADEAGELLGESPAARLERIAPGMRDRVEDLRTKISGRLKTLVRQETRGVSENYSAARMKRLLDDTETRIAKADAKANELGGAVDILGPERTRLSQRIARLEGAASEAQAVRARAERRLRGAENRAASAEGRANLPRPGSGAMKRNEGFMQARQSEADLAAAEANRATEAEAAAQQAVEEAKAELGGLPGATPGVEKALTRAEAELLTLDREANRIAGVAQSAAERGMKTEERYLRSLEGVEGLREELFGIRGEWQRALDRSRQTPRNQGQIGIAQLQGTTFPDAVANAANAYLRSEQKGSSALGALNNIMRGLRATGDVSFLGIQGLLGLAHEPGSYGRAWKAAMQGIGDPDALAKFIDDFDAKALAASLPGSKEWIKAGLRLGGADTEFALRAKGLLRSGDKIEKLPIIRQSNRAFGYFGDALRLDAAGAMRLANPNASLGELAQAANLMTGWTKGRFLGDAGEWVQFAPRFFQSQLELVARALTDKSATGEQARRMLVKLIGIGGSLTVAANEAMGGSTDFNPASPNFMRVRVAGQDVSLFGPWDSLVKAIVNAGKGDFEYLARTKASPLVATTWDAITGRTFTGDPVLSPLKPGEADPEKVVNFLKSFLPFTAQDTIREGIGAGTAIGLTGVKSAPLSKADLVDEVARDAFGESWEDLSAQEVLALAERFPERIDAKTARAAASVKKSLAPYYAIEDDVWDRINDRSEFAQYKTLDDFVEAKAESLRQAGVPEREISSRLEALPVVGTLNSAVRKLRQRYRLAHPEVDDILVSWYNATPIRQQMGAGRRTAAARPAEG